MPHYPQFFLANTDYSIKNYLRYLKTNGQDLNENDVKTYIQWYRTDLDWKKAQKNISLGQIRELERALNELKHLSDKDLKATIVNTNNPETPTIINKYINKNSINAPGNTISFLQSSEQYTLPPPPPPPQQQQQQHEQQQQQQQQQQQAAAASTSSNNIQLQTSQPQQQATNKRKSDCIEQLPQKRQQQRQDDDDDGELLDIGIEYQPPSPDDRYLVGNFDASQAFYDFQLFVANHKAKYYLESHLHHVLAASSILLVRPGRMPKELVDVFGEQQLDSFINDLRTRIDMNSRRNSRLPMKLILYLTSIVEDVLAGVKSRTQGMCSLLSMEGKAFSVDGELIIMEEEEVPIPGRVTKQQFRFIKSLANLLDKLPNKVIMEEIKEHELCTRYLDPILCGLFDNPSDSVFFRWTDHSNLESKKSALVSKRRPDSCIARLNGVKWDNTLAYGEVKCAGESDNLYGICKDTLRVGLFSKNALDVGKMKGILGFQAVGRTITFYLTTLLKDGLYTMMELAEITIPGSVDDLPKYLMDLTKVLLVLDVCDNWCTPVDLDQIQLQSQRSRPTLSTPSFCRIVSSSTCRSRQSIMKSYYN
ncbi:uncharacterized protein BX664DRAFT_382639 [Halteromyces radiatus]|uniref:uncharacterized protein n=1 Tax=Halteromyces radiatus TaxID=101107 RepID=UPI00221E8DB7|nr:uncharacterized protein BX664DRAFT_382639 [Halteromyces radiatus]KAI8096143.1 hypothetical protein BX664DRAFT_382639 [Halteromyces radiatus]